MQRSIHKTSFSCNIWGFHGGDYEEHVFCDVTPWGSSKNVSEEHIASIIRLTRIGELGTLSVTSNGCTMQKKYQHTHKSFICSMRWLLVSANVVPSSSILVSWWWRGYVPPKLQFLQEPHCVTSQKMAFFKFNLITKQYVLFVTLHAIRYGVQIPHLTHFHTSAY
jgi:hypothetical protein